MQLSRCRRLLERGQRLRVNNSACSRARRDPDGRALLLKLGADPNSRVGGKHLPPRQRSGLPAGCLHNRARSANGKCLTVYPKTRSSIYLRNWSQLRQPS